MNKCKITHNAGDAESPADLKTKAEAFGRMKHFLIHTMNNAGLSNHTADVDVIETKKDLAGLNRVIIIHLK